MSVPHDDDVRREQLQDAGLRVTAPRVAVLAAVAAHPHSTVETLAHVVRNRLGRVSVQAIYDVLAARVQAGLVRRIQPARSPGR